MCDDSWDIKDGHVACRMMGYVGAESVATNGLLDQSDFIMDDVMCNGDEMSLYHCPYNPGHNCGNTEGAQVTCKTLTLHEGKKNTSKDFEIIPTIIFSVIYQGVFIEDVTECKQLCNSNTPGCHGYVYVDDIEENEANMRGRCYLKFGNVYVN